MMQAMEPYDHIAPFYDIEHARLQDDVEFYREWARACGSPVLDIGCGTGRLTLPLAADGGDVTGVDTSAAMLERARAAVRTAHLDDRVTLVQADARALALEQRFRLAFCGLGSFAHFTSRAEQEAVLASMRRHLAPGGTLILDLGNAELFDLVERTGQVLHQGTWEFGSSGHYLSHLLSATPDPVGHCVQVTHFYDEYEQGGPVQRTVAHTTLYLFSRGEIELLLAAAGFAIDAVYGSYELDPYDDESPRLLVVATRD
jgi:ubiquinone/menaquinone biosynthesis C-methylase UbiE